MRSLAFGACAALLSSAGVCWSQVSTPSTTQTTILCDEAAGCSHEFIDGLKYKIITNDNASVSVAISSNGKYARVSVSITNKSATPIDVLPDQFGLMETAPKNQALAYVSYEKIVRSDERRAGWANALNSFGAGMATQQVTTQTTSSGTVNATSSDGTYTNGTYDGSSTSTTTVPDYAARARAEENLRRRREALRAELQAMSQTSLKSNTVMPNQTVSGLVYFDFSKKVKNANILIPIGNVVYEFPYVMEWKH